MCSVQFSNALEFQPLFNKVAATGLSPPWQKLERQTDTAEKRVRGEERTHTVRKWKNENVTKGASKYWLFVNMHDVAGEITGN